MSRTTFLKGALILTVAGIVVKIIGSVNRILISRLLGGEGVGLYQMAYPIYLLALSISSAGIPVAISIIVAEKVALGDFKGANRVFRISLGVLSVTGLVFTFLLYFGAGWLIEHQFVRDARAYWAIIALAPAIFFVTVLSSYRGYFQGLQMMTPTAVSQIYEQLFRVVTMIVLAYFLLDHGLEYAAAGASFGAGPGAAAGLVVLLYYYVRHRAWFKGKMTLQSESIKKDSVFYIVSRIVKLALPVSLANIMLPIAANIDLLVVPARLEVAGHATARATELFGYLTGMAVPLVNMATILTASLAVSLVPAVSEAHALKEKAVVYQRTANAMRIANIITLPSFVGMALLATPISQMLYGTPNAGTSIAIMAVGIFLLGIHQVTTGVLQGLGRTAIPVVNMFVALVLKFAISWHFTAIAGIGIKGAAWATVADFGVAALLNMYFVYKYVGFAVDLKDTFKAAVACVVMGITVLFVYHGLMAELLNNNLATLGAILAGALVYAAGLFLTGAVDVKDIERLPRVGDKLARILAKLKLLRR
ncbi:MAG: polysaccharide biosynthesis protein [Sporomusaceae bacterium]|nr:polysaccharide biosynthesis protein [Sporomusaceae bacterium]